MKIAQLIAVLVIASALGPAFAQPKKPSTTSAAAAFTKDAKALLERQMKDPSSVQYRGVYVARRINSAGPDEMILCGEVNAKNSYGGYVGFRPFISSVNLVYTGDQTAEVLAFKRHNPCPTTGQRRGACPGWAVDHIRPLCAGGEDRPENMQWITTSDHRFKTLVDVRECRKEKKRMQG